MYTYLYNNDFNFIGLYGSILYCQVEAKFMGVRIIFFMYSHRLVKPLNAPLIKHKVEDDVSIGMSCLMLGEGPVSGVSVSYVYICALRAKWVLIHCNIILVCNFISSLKMS